MNCFPPSNDLLEVNLTDVSTSRRLDVLLQVGCCGEHAAWIGRKPYSVPAIPSSWKYISWRETKVGHRKEWEDIQTSRNIRCATCTMPSKYCTTRTVQCRCQCWNILGNDMCRDISLPVLRYVCVSIVQLVCMSTWLHPVVMSYWGGNVVKYYFVELRAH